MLLHERLEDPEDHFLDEHGCQLICWMYSRSGACGGRRRTQSGARCRLSQVQAYKAAASET